MAQFELQHAIIRGVVMLSGNGFAALFATCCAGAGLLIASGISASDITDNLEEGEPTWPFLVPAFLSGLAVAAGSSGDRRRLRFLAAGGLISVTVVAAVGSASLERDEGVSEAEFIAGILLGPLAGAALPLVAYHWIGRKLANRQLLLFGLWVVSLAALYVYLFFVFWYTGDLIGCGDHPCFDDP